MPLCLHIAKKGEGISEATRLAERLDDRGIETWEWPVAILNSQGRTQKKNDPVSTRILHIYVYHAMIHVHLKNLPLKIVTCHRFRQNSTPSVPKYKMFYPIIVMHVCKHFLACRLEVKRVNI
jgi:hypothetical protein